jgi:hypothetical protein
MFDYCNISSMGWLRIFWILRLGILMVDKMKYQGLVPFTCSQSTTLPITLTHLIFVLDVVIYFCYSEATPRYPWFHARPLGCTRAAEPCQLTHVSLLLTVFVPAAHAHQPYFTQPTISISTSKQLKHARTLSSATNSSVLTYHAIHSIRVEKVS